VSAEVRDVSLGLDDATVLFQDLEEYVVSLDRILSRIGSGADPAILVDYIVERKLRDRLARARGFVGDALELVLDEAEVERIAENGFRYSD
jgi:hypothetical protein